MIALGNDVVDLREEPKNGPSYYARLSAYACQESELRQLAHHFTLKTRLAILWSVKEAAYKSSVKMGLTVPFRPSGFHCHFSNLSASDLEGQVHFASQKLQFKSHIYAEFIHSVTFLREVPITLGTTQTLANSTVQSRDVRRAAIGALGQPAIILKTEKGIPFFVVNEETDARELSLSHHGTFAAYAFEK